MSLDSMLTDSGSGLKKEEERREDGQEHFFDQRTTEKIEKREDRISRLSQKLLQVLSENHSHSKESVRKNNEVI